MRYDSAQCARVYLHAWQITHDEAYRRVVEETLDKIAREMLDPKGGYYSGQNTGSVVEGRLLLPCQIS